MRKSSTGGWDRRPSMISREGAFDPGHGRPLPPFPGGPGHRGLPGPDEGLRAVQPVEEWDQTVDVPGRGRLVPGPRRQPQAVAEPSHLGEDLEGARGAQPGDLQVDGLLEMIEVGLDPLASEQGLRMVSPTEQQFDGDLGLDELVGGDAEAGLVLGLGVEGADALGGEDAEQAVAEGVDHEGVPVPSPLAAEEGRGIRQQPQAAAHPGDRAAHGRGRGLDPGNDGGHRPGAYDRGPTGRAEPALWYP